MQPFQFQGQYLTKYSTCGTSNTFIYAISTKHCVKEAITTGVQNDALLLAGKI